MCGSKCIKYIIFSFLLAATWHCLYSRKLLPCSNSSYFYILSPDANNEVKGVGASVLGLLKLKRPGATDEVKKFL